ncbi:hypothetical protein [Marivita hallyeonensis]|uniref:Uncharacterized protein n=1 Tax=Marivita hallyeonensis TaxID=996342 RepID=A0A1M5RAN9_9RHOB|nr:hypothetical protein [Marivita hallyeonensis]SHH23321.1 hypothetical protein SAMN05443551_1682 [Marivita hallyeonensis]
MVRRQNFRIARFSMAHASVLMVLLALGATLDTQVSPAAQAALATPQDHAEQPRIIKAAFWSVFQCDEAKDVDV